MNRWFELQVAKLAAVALDLRTTHREPWDAEQPLPLGTVLKRLMKHPRATRQAAMANLARAYKELARDLEGVALREVLGRTSNAVIRRADLMNAAASRDVLGVKIRGIFVSTPTVPAIRTTMDKRTKPAPKPLDAAPRRLSGRRTRRTG